MKALIFTIILIPLFSGCTSAPLNLEQLPKALVGTTVSSKFTGWGRNWCSKGEPVKDLYNSPALNCTMIGGEIHLVRITNARSLIDGSSIQTFDVLIPAPVDDNESHGIVLKVELAPNDLVSDTGVKYWATDFAFQYSQCPEDGIKFPTHLCFQKLRDKYAK